jgi:hypothetical protein
LVCKKLPGSGVTFWLYESLPPALRALLGRQLRNGFLGGSLAYVGWQVRGHLLIAGPVKRDPLNKGQLTS